MEVWSYLDDRCLTQRTPMGKRTAAIWGYADEDHRVRTAARIHEAQSRGASRVIGRGRVFGYRNVHVFTGTDANGNPMRSHVDREVVPADAASAAASASS